MTYHVWGDDWPHWEELHEAEAFIRDYVYKYSMCRLVSKEKWGTIRYEYLLPPGSLSGMKYTICAPWIRRTKYGAYRPILWTWSTSFIHSLWLKLGKCAFRKALAAAIKKYPNVKREILEDRRYFCE